MGLACGEAGEPLEVGCRGWRSRRQQLESCYENDGARKFLSSSGRSVGRDRMRGVGGSALLLPATLSDKGERGRLPLRG